MKDLLTDIRTKLQNGQYRNEEHVRLSLVARILRHLGWNIWNPSEVYTEFNAVPQEDRTRVDVALFLNSKIPQVFIEVKPVGRLDQELGQIERQLRDYNRNNSALICIITDGRKWRFYYPLTAGEFSQKCFETFDLLTDDLDNIELTLDAFLSKDEISSGSAENEAKVYLKRTQKQRAMHDALPQARKLILEYPYPSIIDAVLKILDTQGYTLTTQEISDFIQNSRITERSIERTTDYTSKLPDDVVGLSQNNSFSKPETLSTSKYAHNNTRQIESVLPSDDPINRGYIPIPTDFRYLFPGFKEDFVLETDIGERIVKVSSGTSETKIGDPSAGHYLTGKLQPWYKKHQELKRGDILIIEIIEPMKRYRLITPK